MKQRVARKFRELDEDGEGISLADVATLLTDVLGRQLDRDAMLRLAANVFDNAEKSEQDLLQLPDVLKSMEPGLVKHCYHCLPGLASNYLGLVPPFPTGWLRKMSPWTSTPWSSVGNSTTLGRPQMTRTQTLTSSHSLYLMFHVLSICHYHYRGEVLDFPYVTPSYRLHTTLKDMSWACVQRLAGLVLPPDSIWLYVPGP